MTVLNVMWLKKWNHGVIMCWNKLVEKFNLIKSYLNLPFIHQRPIGGTELYPI